MKSLELIWRSTRTRFSNERQRLNLTHCGPLTPYGGRDLGQRWLRWCLVAWRHQAITWTNVDLSSLRSRAVHLRANSLEISQLSVTKTSLKIIFLRFYWNLPGTNELKIWYQGSNRSPGRHGDMPFLLCMASGFVSGMNSRSRRIGSIVYISNGTCPLWASFGDWVQYMYMKSTVTRSTSEQLWLEQYGIWYLYRNPRNDQQRHLHNKTMVIPFTQRHRKWWWARDGQNNIIPYNVAPRPLAWNYANYRTFKQVQNGTHLQ